MAYRTDNPKPATIWAREHPEKVKGYIAKRLEKNPDYYKEKVKQWEIENPEKRQAYLDKTREQRVARAKQWGNDHPDKRAEASRKYLLKKRFGDEMTPEKFQEMFDAQNGKCAICGIAPLDKHLSIDHDHETGAVRGLLCNPCNLALGNVKDNTLILENMIRYLNRTTIQD